MHPSVHAIANPDKPALLFGHEARVITYGELDRRSNQIAHFFRNLGLQPGDAAAIFLENVPDYLDIAWACQRAGLYAVPISSHLLHAELAYILADSGARLLIASPGLSDVARDAIGQCPGLPVYWIGSTFDEAVDRMPSTPIADETAGGDMVYSSGTTGRPKGVRPPLAGGPIDAPTRMALNLRDRYAVDDASVYLSPAPLYHAAPLRWVMAVQRLGGTAVIMEKFDAGEVLRLIAVHGVTHAQFVPTHFSRLLRLPDAERSAADLSSLKTVIHAAAPCPPDLKHAMLGWFGPIIHEYYAGSEGNGITMIGPEEWIERPGSVGRAVGCQVRICDEEGAPLGAGEEGTIFFEGGAAFEYHNDPDKTAASRHPLGWSTIGDVGRLDAEGYLYLTDRKSFMIISGGVNIYPQEIENALLAHPAVADAAVVGAPHPDFGEQVAAIIQPVRWEEAGAALEADLRAFLSARISPVKAPRSYGFMQELPRLPTGKLLKRVLRDAYAGNNAGIMADISDAQTLGGGLYSND